MIKKGIFNRKDPLQSEYHISEAYSFGSSEEETCKIVFSDEFDNIYIGGYFSLTINVDLLGGIHELTSNGGKDAFLVKYDEARNIIWCRTWGGVDFIECRDINIKNDIVYITGAYKGTADFNPSNTETFELTSVGSNDIFITTLTTSGDFINAVSIGGTGDDNGNKSCVDNNDNCYISLKFYDSIVLDTITGLETVIISWASSIMIKFNSDLKVVWYRLVVSTSASQGRCVDLDSVGNVYFGGWHKGIADLDTGIGEEIEVSGISSETHIIKFDSDGNQLWTKVIQSSNISQVLDLTVDGDDIYIVGTLRGEIDFGTGIVIDTSLYGSYSSSFVAKYDLDGNFQWFRSMDDDKDSSFSSVKVRQNGDIVMVGGSAAIDRYIDDGLGNKIIQTNPDGQWSSIMLVYDTNGILKYYDAIIGYYNGSFQDCFVDINDDILIVGVCRNTAASLIVNGVSKVLTTPIKRDIILLKYSSNN